MLLPLGCSLVSPSLTVIVSREPGTWCVCVSLDGVSTVPGSSADGDSVTVSDPCVEGVCSAGAVVDVGGKFEGVNEDVVADVAGNVAGDVTAVAAEWAGCLHCVPFLITDFFTSRSLDGM